LTVLLIVAVNGSRACLRQNVPGDYECDSRSITLADAKIHQFFARCIVSEFGVGTAFEQVRKPGSISMSSLASDGAATAHHLWVEAVDELLMAPGRDKYHGRVDEELHCV
jgi:hypothetical protein